MDYLKPYLIYLSLKRNSFLKCKLLLRLFILKAIEVNCLRTFPLLYQANIESRNSRFF